MSFTRQLYDSGTHLGDTHITLRPGQYQLLKQSRMHDSVCYQSNPELRPRDLGVYHIGSNDMSLMESDLFNLNRKNTKNPLYQYPFVKCGPYDQPQLNDCSTNCLNRVYAKLDGNQFNREKQIDIPRFESLCLNPQKLTRIHDNTYIGLNTRLYNRDIHSLNYPYSWPKYPVKYYNGKK